jgi:hypothetical protein
MMVDPHHRNGARVRDALAARALAQASLALMRADLPLRWRRK